jgi:hypothetical protein
MKAPKSTFEHNKHSWHECAANIILSDDADVNNKIRVELGRALFWYQAIHYHNKDTSMEQKLMRASSFNEALLAVGQQVFKNAVDNGLTADSAGE